MEGLLVLGRRRMGSSSEGAEDFWAFGVDHVEPDSEVCRSGQGRR